MAEKTYDVRAVSRVAFSGILATYQLCAKYSLRLLRQLVIGTVLVFAIGGYYGHKQQELRLSRLETEKAIAAIKAEEAEVAMIRAVQAPLTSSCASIGRAI